MNSSRNWRVLFAVLFTSVAFSQVTPIQAELMALQPTPLPGAVQETIDLSLEIPDVDVQTDQSGLSTFKIDGYESLAHPGDPLLPGSIIAVALPYDIRPDSIVVTASEADVSLLPAIYQVPSAGPHISTTEGAPIQDWGQNTATIRDGRNTLIYEQDAFFPSVPVQLDSYGQMRKWRFVRIRIDPVSWNPVTGLARVVESMNVRIGFERAPINMVAQWPAIQQELADSMFDDRAANMFVNFDQAQTWYSTGPASASEAEMTALRPGFAIVTTNRIVRDSDALDEFVAHKTSLGYNVVTVTQNQYGGLTGQAPNGTPEKIREWLKQNYLGLQLKNVLLIGNPDPDDPAVATDSVGDLPMKMVYPSAQAGDLAFTVPTDYLYADLTGNWDLNGDLLFGDVPDRQPGGVDLAAEVYVGRIPVYRMDSNWVTTLDSILRKTISYEQTEDVLWRKSALLPMAFMDANLDEAPMAELMETEYLADLGFRTYKLYEQGARGPQFDSIYASDQELIDGAVRTHWQEHPYGMVVWATHGWPMGAVLVLQSWETAYLNDSRPAFTFQMSCSNGVPEEVYNLGYSLLRQGAVGTISAARVSWGYYRPPNPLGGSNTDHAFFHSERIAHGWAIGESLYTTKAQFTAFDWLANRTMYNLYGDPSLALNVGDAKEPNDTLAVATPFPLGSRLTDLSLDPVGAPTNGDVDFFKFDGRIGETIYADVRARRDGSPLDATLQLQGPNGNTVLASNNNFGGSPDPYLEFRLPADGTYYLRVRSARHPNDGGPDYTYSLQVVRDLYEPNDTMVQATTIAYGQTLSAEVHPVFRPQQSDWDVDYYRFSGKVGDHVAGRLLDTFVGELKLLGPNGTPLLDTSDCFGNCSDQLVQATLPVTGDYYLRVKPWFGEAGPATGPYSLELDMMRFVSAATGGTVAGLDFDRSDILAYYQKGARWELLLDASDVGITQNLSAFSILPGDAGILMSFQYRQVLADLMDMNGNSLGRVAVMPQDVVLFNPRSLGDNTSGSFSWLFDGSDAGLADSGEAIDALALAPDGRLLVSTTGAASVPGIVTADEDLLAFSPSAWGSATAGTWSLYFDGSTVAGLAVEDIVGAAVDSRGYLYVTLSDSFTVGGVSGGPATVIGIRPNKSVFLEWDSTKAKSNYRLDGLDLPDHTQLLLLQ